MQDLADTLLALLTADTLDQAAALALRAWSHFVDTTAACVLCWDGELARYVIGDTWTDALERTLEAPAIRREALRVAQQAHQVNSQQLQYMEPDWLYQPLNFQSRHVGAFVGIGVKRFPDIADEDYQWLLRAAPRAFYHTAQVQEAEQEQVQTSADRTRLEKLLQAVEQQQRTIDRLLTSERQLSASLEAKVEERTIALRVAQDKLIQSEKLAVIGKLASSLAHELNNPLQAIQSGLGLLMTELDSGNVALAKDDLTIIQDELERIESIFHHMLDFYRPVSYQYVPLDLNAICEGVRILMRKRLQEMNVVLDLQLMSNLPLTCGDSNQIKQVLLNLTLNAAEAMPPTGGNIAIRTQPNENSVCILVIDNGSGIEVEHLAHLFEPLFTTKTRGLGLGLAISQEIALRHDGTIIVESTLGRGTVFTLHLPIREQCYDRK